MKEISRTTSLVSAVLRTFAGKTKFVPAQHSGSHLYKRKVLCFKSLANCVG